MVYERVFFNNIVYKKSPQLLVTAATKHTTMLKLFAFFALVLSVDTASAQLDKCTTCVCIGAFADQNLCTSSYEPICEDNTLHTCEEVSSSTQSAGSCHGGASLCSARDPVHHHVIAWTADRNYTDINTKTNDTVTFILDGGSNSSYELSKFANVEDYNNCSFANATYVLSEGQYNLTVLEGPQYYGNEIYCANGMKIKITGLLSLRHI